MLTSYMKSTLRRLAREPQYTLIGVSGLAVGMACCLLVLRYLAVELPSIRSCPMCS